MKPRGNRADNKLLAQMKRDGDAIQEAADALMVLAYTFASKRTCREMVIYNNERAKNGKTAHERRYGRIMAKRWREAEKTAPKSLRDKPLDTEQSG